MGRGPSWVCATLLGTLGLQCAKARPVAQDNRGVLTWRADIQPVFASRCTPCHAGANPGGQYDLTTYLGVLGNGRHSSPDAVAGDPSSTLVRVLSPTLANAIHRPLTDLYPTVRKWVVEDDLALFNSSIHGGGILNPADPQFHGQVLRDTGWDFSRCASCHGADFSGGLAQSSCTSCHAQGVTACSTCHGRYGQSQSHPAHVDGGVLGHAFACAECHLEPSSYTDVGHLFEADGGAIQTPAAVIFGALASAAGPARQGPPAWDSATRTCSNVYCHGDVFADTNASLTKPRFDAPGSGQAACGTCHGLPPSSHASGQTQCSNCHGQVFDSSRHLISPPLHINGRVDVGDNSGTCSACHGDLTSSAPPRDLSGNTDTSALGVGAHRSHVQALHRLGAPMGCGGCHFGTPQKVLDPGHIDSPPPARVFPGGASFTGLAAADGALPAWDRATATCTNTYCHGGGTHLAADTSVGLNRTPVWTSVGAGEAGCGSCHGVPPQDGVVGHDAGTPLTRCAACHAATMDSSGAIIVLPDGGSAHINGAIDVFP